MPDPHRFTSKSNTLSGEDEVQWGDDWSSEIDQQEGIAVENGAVVPSGTPGPTDGLIARYPFDDGTATDATGTNDGTVHGATHLSNGGPQGNGAFEFDGSSDYVSADEAPITGSQDRTVAAWIYPYARGTNHHVVTSWGDASVDGGKTQFYIHDSGNLRVEIASDGYTTSFSPTLDTWSFVGYTLNGSTMADYTVYLNDTVEAASGTGSTTVDTRSTNPLHIGHSSPNGDRWWDGRLDEVRIYDRALSDSEMQDLYDATR